MDRLKHLYVLIVFTLSMHYISAQNTLVVDESIFIHTNTTTFVTGETLLFKIYCLKASDNTPSAISKIAYVEIVDQKNAVIFKTKIIIEDATGEGYYFIPTTLNTGIYKLIAYTNWTLNKRISNLFEVDLNIINPYINIVESNVSFFCNTVLEKSKIGVDNSNTLYKRDKITLQIPSKQFNTRELVPLKFNINDPTFKKGSYSLSVKKIDNLPKKDQVTAEQFCETAKTTPTTVIDVLNKKIILPEIRGENISGKIISNLTDTPLNDISIGLSIPGKSFIFKTVKTNEDGKFNFSVHNNFTNENFIVQVIDDKAYNFEIIIDAKPSLYYDQLNFSADNLINFKNKDDIINRSISNQIENAYYHKKNHTVSPPVLPKPFYYPANKEYFLSNYTRFKTLKETILEVVTEIYMKQKDGKTHLYVNDPSIFPQLNESALVLVDGLFIENQNELLLYNMSNVEKIDIIIGRYYVGPKAFNGLISFTTFNSDFKIPLNNSYTRTLSNQKPQSKINFYKKDYNSQGDGDRIPDFRTQLLWDSNINLEDELIHSFYTSDLAGLYEISLQGFSYNGDPISIKENIQVIDTLRN